MSGGFGGSSRKSTPILRVPSHSPLGTHLVQGMPATALMGNPARSIRSLLELSRAHGWIVLDPSMRTCLPTKTMSTTFAFEPPVGRSCLTPRSRRLTTARRNIPDLARQYWRYGFWKARMLQAYPNSIRWRQAMPPAFVTLSVLLLLAGFFLRSAWLVLGVQWAIYGGLTVAAGIGASVRSKYRPGILRFSPGDLYDALGLGSRICYELDLVGVW